MPSAYLVLWKMHLKLLQSRLKKSIVNFFNSFFAENVKMITSHEAVHFIKSALLWSRDCPVSLRGKSTVSTFKNSELLWETFLTTLSYLLFFDLWCAIHDHEQINWLPELSLFVRLYECFYHKVNNVLFQPFNTTP